VCECHVIHNHLRVAIFCKGLPRCLIMLAIVLKMVRFWHVHLDMTALVTEIALLNPIDYSSRMGAG
jgi:hypothetical protein